MDASSHASGGQSLFRDPDHFLSGFDSGAVSRLIQQSTDIAVIIEDGRVKDVAVMPDDLRKAGFGEGWIGQPWINTVNPDSRGKIEALLAGGEPGTVARARQVNHPSRNVQDIPVAYRTLRAGPSNSLIALGRDLREASELQQRLIHAQQKLERDYAQMRRAEARYKVIFESVSEPILIVTTDDFLIETGNRAAAEALGVDAAEFLQGELTSAFAPAAARQLDRFAARAAASGGAELKGVELLDGRRCNLFATLFGSSQDARLIVKIQTKQAPAAAGPTRFLQALDDLPDGLIVCDPELRILSVNRAFLDMVHQPGREAMIGARLADFLGRSQTDINVLMSSLKTHGAARNFATVLRDRYNTEDSVEVSAVSTGEGDDTMLAFSIRSVARRINLDPPLGQELPRSVDHLTNLVGRMPLKDIVRDSTTLIERLCIEAALKITEDNRASAAEILGLSRQGLYSKLKRFGFEDKA
jgi:transcriptional regulator PpsR